MLVTPLIASLAWCAYQNFEVSQGSSELTLRQGSSVQNEALTSQPAANEWSFLNGLSFVD